VKGLVNIIWRNAPIYERDSDNRFVRDSNKNYTVKGHADQVAIWESGVETFKLLAAKDVAFKGISSRDFVVTREGTGRDTRYSVEPDDADGGPQELSDEDQTLLNDSKYDLEDIAGFVDINKFNEVINRKLEKSESSDVDDLEGFIKPEPFEGTS
jgi:hypothetical protein